MPAGVEDHTVELPRAELPTAELPAADLLPTRELANADLPVRAPAEPPRILKRPAPLAPASIDIVPRAAAESVTPRAAPHSSIAPVTDPRVVGLPSADLAPTRLPPAAAREPPVRASPARPIDAPAPARPVPARAAAAPDAHPPAPARDAPAPARDAPAPVRPAPPSALDAPAGALDAPAPVRAAPVRAREAPGRALDGPARAPDASPARDAPARALDPPAPARAAPVRAPAAAGRAPDGPARPRSPLIDPEGESAVLVLPGFGRWLGAGVIDVVIGAAVAGGAVAGLLSSRGVRVAWQPIVDFLHLDAVSGGATLLLSPLLALVAVQLASLLVLGATVGQRVAGLRVVRSANGAAPGPGRAALRALAGSLGVVALLVGPLWGFWVDRRRRGLGDLVARTVVVRRMTPSARHAPARGDR